MKKNDKLNKIKRDMQNKRREENKRETEYLSSIPGLKESIIEGLRADPSEFVSEDKVKF
ncbi:hypothetical protein [Fenollaria massiliensis]|uniref:Uncharacterized protein n=1 Tax=Fenollaria massiliensis TaxID=938288 RepID=A0A9E7DJP9_9FIRM|nr:hypothetical protein [Fenollaria massiliensis]UQK59151.1 hypothetical protein M1R53_00330 [Fenollaria massiliensis]